mgnify:CR=1 FL=1
MTKEELQKTYNEVVLNTNGGNDDYVVALCQIANAIDALDDSQHVVELQKKLNVTEKALELACEELYDSDSISICDYCPYDIEDECANECSQNTKVLEKYFKEQAEKELKGESHE